MGYGPEALTVDSEASCAECNGVGVLLSKAFIVQRCDSCQAFPDDIAAAYSLTSHPVTLTCRSCQHWEMSVAVASISCPECGSTMVRAKQ